MRPNVHSIALALSSLLALTALPACPDREISALPSTPATVERKEIPLYPELDLLFVIDNSRSMRDEQESLAANFQKFIDILEMVDGGLPSLHLGVITSDLGSQGGRRPLGCTSRGGDGILRWPGHADRFIRDIHGVQPGDREKNYTGSLREAFAGMAVLNEVGCGFEAHLGALQTSLYKLENDGFFREAAYLGIVVIADEDDCTVERERAAGFFAKDLDVEGSFACFLSSTTCDGATDPKAPGARSNCREQAPSPYHVSVDEVVKELKAFKNEQETIVAGIIGPTTPVTVAMEPVPDRTDVPPQPQVQSSCPAGATTNTADPGIRLTRFVSSFRNHALASICNADLTAPIELIARKVSEALEDAPCLRSAIVEPHDCTVADVVDPRGPNRREYPLVKCDDNLGNQPCWRLVSNPDLCAATPSKLELRVERGSTARPAGSRIIAECVTERM